MPVQLQWQQFDKATEYHTFTPPYAETCVPEIMAHYREKLGSDHNKVPFVIDVACGNGQFAEVLAPYCGEVLAFDISAPQVEIGRRMSTNPNVTYEVESVFHMSRLLTGDFERKADLMTSAIASHYFNTPEFYQEVRKCLKIGGILAEVMYVFGGIIGFPEEANQECNDFFNRVIADDGSDEEFNHMYEITRSKYQKLNVLLDEVEWKPCRPVFSYWGREEISNYLLTCRPKKKDFSGVTRKFFNDLWIKYADGKEKVKIQFNGYVVYSRNMKHEESDSSIQSNDVDKQMKTVIRTNNGPANGTNGHKNYMNVHANSTMNINSMNGHTNGMNGHENSMNGHVNGINGHSNKVNGYLNGVIGHANDTLNGHANGTLNGHTKGMNGHANGTLNGHTKGMNGHANGMNSHVNGLNGAT